MAIAISLFAIDSFAQAQIVFLDTIYDYGVFYQTTTPMPCRLRFTNTGDSALVITRVQPTCGCTTTDFPTRPIAPGDTASITLTYTPIGRPGPFSKDVFVYSNGLVHKTIVSIKGRMIGNPESINRYYPEIAGATRLSRTGLLAGEITKGKTRNLTTALYNNSSDTISLSVMSQPQHVSLHFVDSILPPADVAQIALFFDTRMAPYWGHNNDTVKFVAKHFNGNPADTVTLTVTAVVTQDFESLTAEQLAAAPIAVLPTTLIDLNAIKNKTLPLNLSFEISNAGTDPLEVRRVYSETDLLQNFSCSRRLLKSGERATVSFDLISLPPEKELLEASVFVITNDPLHPTQVVKLAGIIPSLTAVLH